MFGEGGGFQASLGLSRKRDLQEQILPEEPGPPLPFSFLARGKRAVDETITPLHRCHSPTIPCLQSCCLLSCVKPGLGGCSCPAVSPILSECPHLSHIHSWKSVLFVGFLAVLLSWGLHVCDSPQMASDVMLDSSLVFWRK